jgi:hypothetical protein
MRYVTASGRIFPRTRDLLSLPRQGRPPPPGRPPQAGEHFSKLRLTVSRHAGHAQDLTLVEIERRSAQGREASIIEGEEESGPSAVLPCTTAGR